MNLAALSISELAPLIRDRQISPVEVTRLCLRRIEHLNPKLNAFIHVAADTALREAEQAEHEISTGRYNSPLHGIPIALKDMIDVAGEKTTAASRLFANNIASSDAEVVRHLRRAGAIILGKLNLHEFAYGGSGVISAYGPALNPWNAAHITGGSSSGSAAAVAAGLCYAALGTDTAGSIRVPAAMCGIVGLKPTHGLVSTSGVVPLSESLDHVGPMARTVEDARLVFEALRRELLNQELAASTVPRIGIAREFFFNDLSHEIESCLESALDSLERLGELREIAIPIDNDRTLQRGESYRYHRQFLADRASLYDPETLRRIHTGEDVTESMITDQREALRRFRQRSMDIFTDVDFVITPTSPIEAPTLARLQGSPELRPTELLMLRNTRPFNVLGWPAVSVPCGLTSKGLPVGIQIAAAPNEEDGLLRFAAELEQDLNFQSKQLELIAGLY